MSGHRIVVYGGRDLDPARVCKWLERNAVDVLAKHYGEHHDIACIIEGGATGADRGGRVFAVATHTKCHTDEADWDRYGRNAGAIRNRHMLMTYLPSFGFEFPGHNGTKNMHDHMIATDIPFHIVKGDFKGGEPRRQFSEWNRI